MRYSTVEKGMASLLTPSASAKARKRLEIQNVRGIDTRRQSLLNRIRIFKYAYSRDMPSIIGRELRLPEQMDAYQGDEDNILLIVGRQIEQASDQSPLFPY